VALVVGLLTAVGGVGFLHVRLAAVPRVDLADSLDDEPDGDSAQNFLLVGTDSAAGLDPDDPVTNPTHPRPNCSASPGTSTWTSRAPASRSSTRRCPSGARRP
jgi:hypothetical protein